MRIYEDWIRAHLPKDLPDQEIDCFAGYYLDGLNVMAEGERGGPDTLVYAAQDKEDLRFIEISDSKEHDGDHVEEPRPGSIIRVID